MLHKQFKMFTLLLTAALCFAGCGANKGAGLLKSLNSQDAATITKALETANTATLAELTKTSSSPGGDFMYDLTEDGSGIIIKSYTGTASTLIIPDSIEGYPVVEIGKSAAEESNIQVLIIPSTVRIIHSFAFSKSEVISVAILPDESGAGGLKKIGFGAFSRCKQLKTVSLPDSIEKIEDSAFSYCEQLKTVSLPDSIKEIESDAFRFCKSLYRINIPANIKVFGKGSPGSGGGVFLGCSELYELIIPENIQNITWAREDDSYKESFYGCGKLPLATRKRLQELGYKGKF